MMIRPYAIPFLALALLILAGGGVAAAHDACAGAGPQAPRDIDDPAGKNPVRFAEAPPSSEMHLCDIHFHRYAEHKSEGFPALEGEGDHAGYVCAEALEMAHGSDPSKKHEMAGHGTEMAGHGAEAAEGHGCAGEVGDSVEVHWVFTTCDVKPGPTLGSCFSDICSNPELRVEAKVFYLTDHEGDRFSEYGVDAGASQPRSLPDADGAVEYLGSTTGASYDNETCSPYQVTWNVRPTCSPLVKKSLDAWCKGNVFKEDHAHGVRPLVTPPGLLAAID